MHKKKDLRYSLTITNEPLLQSHRTLLTAANTKGGPTRAERTEACLPLAHANTCPTANEVSKHYLYGPTCHVTMSGLPTVAKLPTFTQHQWHVKHNTWSAWCIPGTDEHQHQQTNISKSRTLKYSACKASYSKVKSVEWEDARGHFSSIRAVIYITAGTRSCSTRTRASHLHHVLQLIHSLFGTQIMWSTYQRIKDAIRALIDQSLRCRSVSGTKITYFAGRPRRQTRLALFSDRPRGARRNGSFFHVSNPQI